MNGEKSGFLCIFIIFGATFSIEVHKTDGLELKNYELARTKRNDLNSVQSIDEEENEVKDVEDEGEDNNDEGCEYIDGGCTCDEITIDARPKGYISGLLGSVDGAGGCGREFKNGAGACGSGSLGVEDGSGGCGSGGCGSGSSVDVEHEGLRCESGFQNVRGGGLKCKNGSPGTGAEGKGPKAAPVALAGKECKSGSSCTEAENMGSKKGPMVTAGKGCKLLCTGAEKIGSQKGHTSAEAGGCKSKPSVNQAGGKGCSKKSCGKSRTRSNSRPGNISKATKNIHDKITNKPRPSIADNNRIRNKPPNNNKKATFNQKISKKLSKNKPNKNIYNRIGNQPRNKKIKGFSNKIVNKLSINNSNNRNKNTKGKSVTKRYFL